MFTTENAASRVEQFSAGEAKQSADQAADAFEIAGRRIEAALIKAAKTGELSFRDMAEAILRDLARLAVKELITDPLSGALGGLGGSETRGAGGGTSPINITLNLSGVTDAASLARSQGQLSAALARAVGDGQRFL